MQWDDNTPMDDLAGISPAEAAVVFATEYDEVMKSLFALLRTVGMTDADKDDVLSHAQMLMEATIDIPDGLTVAEMRPYLLVSDVLVLGLLTQKLWDNRDKVIGFGESMGWR